MAHANTYDLLAPMERWTAPNTELRVDSRFMDSYAIQDADLAIQVVTAMNSKDELEVFGVHPADGDLINYYPDSTSDTGWSQDSVGVTVSSSNYQLAAGRTAEGNLIVFVMDEEGYLTHVVEDPQSETRWSAPQQVQLVSPGRTQIICKNFNGQLYIGISIIFPLGNTILMTVYGKQWDSLYPHVSNITTISVTDNLYPQIEIIDGNSEPSLMIFGGNGLLLYNIPLYQDTNVESSNAPTELPDVSLPETDPERIQLPTLQHLSLVNDANGNPVGFGIWNNNILYFIDGAKDFIWQPITQTPSGLRQLRAVFNKNGQLELFATNGSKELCHIRQDTEGVNGWTELTVLGPRFLDITVGLNSDGYSEVFGTIWDTASESDSMSYQNHSLLQTWQDSDTGNWENFRLQTEANGKMEKFISYSTEINVVDAYGRPSPNQDVKVWSPALTFLTINGETFQVDDKTPAICQTNIGGQLTITSKTNTLSAPLLKVWTGLMEPNESVVIEPNLEVQDRLKKVSGQDLLDATDSGDKPLLQPPYNNSATADNMAQAITRSMSLVSPTIGTNATRINISDKTTTRQNLRTLSQDDPSFSSKLDMSGVPEQYWEMDFSSGLPVFKELTAEEAETSINEARAAHPDGSFLGINWGSVWESIKNGIHKLYKFTVRTIENGVHIVIEIGTKVGKVIWDGIISAVEQVFDLVNGIFEQIAVAFERLFEWLGFLFDWNDILEVKEAVKYTVTLGFDVLNEALKFIKSNSDTYFNQLKNNVDNYFNEIIEKQLGKDSLSFLTDVTAPPGFERSNSHNIVSSAYLNNADKNVGFTSTDLNLSEEALNPLNDLMEVFSNLSADFIDSPDFKTAQDYFKTAVSQAQTNPEQALHTTFAAILQSLKALADSAISLTQQMIDAFLDAISTTIDIIKAFLTKTWDIPFVSDLYLSLTGNQITAIELTSLIVAIPMTVCYKIIQNSRVFPDPQSLDNFKAAFTKEKIKQKIEINDSAITPHSAENLPTENELGVSESEKVMMWINVFLLFCNGGFSAGANYQEFSEYDQKPTELENVFSVFVIVSEIGLVATNFALIFIPSGNNQLDVSSEERKGALIVWGFGCLGVLLDIGSYAHYWSEKHTNIYLGTSYRRGKKLNLAGKRGIIITTIYSLVMLVAYLGSALAKPTLPNIGNVISIAPGLLSFIRWFTKGAKAKNVQLFLFILTAGCDGATAILYLIEAIKKSTSQTLPDSILNYNQLVESRFEKLLTDESQSGNNPPVVTENPQSQTVAVGNQVKFTSCAGLFAETSLSSLQANEFLLPGQFLISPNYGYKFVYQQSDGNLVLYRGEDTPANAIWSSSTQGHNPGQAVMQDGGNFVVYDVKGNPVFSSNTQGDEGAWLDVQSDGNVVIYIMKNGQKTWVYQTQTNFIGPNPIPSVQWQVSTDGGVNFTDISGETTPNLTFIAEMSDNGNQYRAVFTNSFGTVASAAAILMVRQG